MLNEDDPRSPTGTRTRPRSPRDYGGAGPGRRRRRLMAEAAGTVAAPFAAVTGDQWARPGAAATARSSPSRRSAATSSTTRSTTSTTWGRRVNETVPPTTATQRRTPRAGQRCRTRSEPTSRGLRRSGGGRAHGCWRSVRRWRTRRADGGAGPAGAAYGHHARFRRAAARGRGTRPTSSIRLSTTWRAREGGPYDAVWANASLLHVARGDLPMVLRRLAAVTRPGGLLRVAVKEGDGDGLVDPRGGRSPARATSPTGGRRRCAPPSTPPAGRCSTLEHGDGPARRAVARGPRGAPAHEAHRVLGPARRRARPGVLPLLGRHVRDRPSSAAPPTRRSPPAYPPSRSGPPSGSALELPPTDR